MRTDSATELAEKIAHGHACSKHVNPGTEEKGNEFSHVGIPGESDGASRQESQEGLQAHLEEVLKDNEGSEYIHAQHDRVVFYHEESNTMTIEDPSHEDGGTSFCPPKGREDFESVLEDEIGRFSVDSTPYPHGAPRIEQGGYDIAHGLNKEHPQNPGGGGQSRQHAQKEATEGRGFKSIGDAAHDSTPIQEASQGQGFRPISESKKDIDHGVGH